MNKIEGKFGGGTIFVPPDKKQWETSLHLNVVPTCGDLIIFDIDLLHSGTPIESGNKYLLGFRFDFEKNDQK